jgi:hypothetical protein
MKHKFRIHECSWPGCGCKTDGNEFWMDAGWASFGAGAGEWSEDDWQSILGLSTSGMLCIHHNEAWEAGEEGDWDRLILLSSL